MDWGQYGGEKGSSISHYLIEFVNFILYNQDMNIPHAVLAVMIDYSKAFNRICHNTIITILSKMGVPGWLLRIVMGFPTEGGSQKGNGFQGVVPRVPDWVYSYFSSL